MADIQFTGSSDFDRVKRDYEELARRTARLETQNRRLASAAGRQAAANRQQRGTQKSLIGEGIKGLASMAAGYLSVSAAIGVANAALKEQQQLQRQAMNAHLGQATADAQVIKNLVGETTKVKTDTLQSLEKIASDVGVESAVPVKLGFSAAISKASGDRELAMDATRRASELNRLAPEDIATFAGGGVTLSKLIGTRDTREAFGFMSEVQARSPVVDPAEMMAELPSAIAAVTASDVRGAGLESSREAGALFAALGQATQQRAKPTGTASIQLAGQLEEFFQAQQAEGGVDPGTLSGRITAIQQSKELQEQLLPTLTGEAKFLPSMRQLLSGEDSIVTREWSKNLSGPGALSVSAEQFETQKTELSGLTESLRLANEVSKDIQTAEEQRLRNVEGAKAGRMRELLFSEERGVIPGSSQGPLDYMERKMTGVAFEAAQVLTGDSATNAIGALQTREMQIRAGRQGSMLFDMMTGGVFSGPKTDAELTKSERAEIKTIRDTIRRLQAEQQGVGGRETAGEIREMRQDMRRMSDGFGKLQQKLSGDAARRDATAPVR